MRRFSLKRKFKKRKSIFKNRFFWDFVLFFLFCCLVFYFLFLSPVFKIEKIEISTKKDIPSKNLRVFLEAKLKLPFFHFFQKDTFFSVNSKKIEKDILNKYPQIKSANLKKKFPRTLVLKIKKREPVAKFCFNLNHCFLIDSSGIIYKGEPSLNLVSIFKEKGEIKNPGEQAISPEKMNKILKIKNYLRDKMKIEITEFYLKKDERIDAKTTQNWQIYFDLSSDINLSLTKLRLLLEKGISPEERKNLKYIDLRFSKVYYK